MTPSCDCYVIAPFVIRQDRSRSAGLQKHFFLALSSQGRFSVPSSALLRARNLVNIRSTPEVIVGSSISRAWTPHAIFLSDRNDPFWECWCNLSNLTNQRVYLELVYRNGSFKEMITGLATPSLPSYLPFYFRLRTFSI